MDIPRYPHEDHTPHHDTRRGSSRYRNEDGYDEADALDDRRERERALDALRARVGRERRASVHAPSAHQVNAVIADAVGLALSDKQGRDAMAKVFGHALRRAVRARGFDPKSLEVKRVLGVRMRPNVRVLEVEAQERVAAEVAARRRSIATDPLSSTLDLIDSLRDDDE